MNISDINCYRLRKKALKRQSQEKRNRYSKTTDVLTFAFRFNKTKEGYDFWTGVMNQVIKSIPKKQNKIDLLISRVEALEKYNDFLSTLTRVSSQRISAKIGNDGPITVDKMQDARDRLTKSLSEKLSKSLGECVKGNDYEIVANEDGSFWINHKALGSGEPFEQWVNDIINK